jgi:hypothetical protein
MTFPSFSAGEVLSATDMNAVGMWLVKSQAVGTGVSSVQVTGAFSADYDNYRVIYTGGTQSSSTDIALQLGASTTGYYLIMNYVLSTTGTNFAAGAANNASFPWVGGAVGGQASHADFHLFNVNKAMYTKIRSGQYQNGDFYGTTQGEHRVATAYSEFTLSVAAGSMTGGTIRVYGYRN